MVSEAKDVRREEGNDMISTLPAFHLFISCSFKIGDTRLISLQQYWGSSYNILANKEILLIQISSSNKIK